MPLGNGPTRGLPSTPLAVYSDLRTYDTNHTAAGDTGFDAIARQTFNGRMSPYAKVIASTPGLAQWWRLNYTAPDWGTTQYGNSAGATTLRTLGAGTVTAAPGLVPGDPSPSAKLAGGSYLDAGDYRVFPMGAEAIMSVEFWVNFDSLLSDVGLVGEWISSSGWMVYYNTGGGLGQYVGDASLNSASGVFVAGQTYHVVCVWGGSSGPTADFVSRAYVNGVQVISGNLVISSGLHPPYTENTRFEIGQYGNGAGANALHGRIQDVSIYNRMLQPREVAQHYQAAFARA